MPGIDDINVHSEELQEVFGTPPRWLVRWGTTIAFLAFVAMIVVAYYVKYPDIIKADITLELPNPPVPVVAENIQTIENIKVDSVSTIQSMDSTAEKVDQTQSQFGEVEMRR